MKTPNGGRVVRKFLVPLIVLTALLPPLSVRASLPTDSILDKPVTLAAKGEALSDIMPMIEKQAGVRLRVAKEIADQKATVFVDDKPLRQVMEGLSTLFGYHWSKKTFSTGDIYELWQEDSARKKLADQHARAWEAAWKAASADIEFKARISAMSKEEREVLRRQLDESGKADSPQVRSQMAAIKQADDPLLGPSARLFGEMRPDVKKMLQPGIEIKYNSLSPESEWAVPEDIARGLVEAIFSSNEARSLVGNAEVVSTSIGFICPDSDEAIDILVAISPTVKTAERSHTVWSMGTALTHQWVFEHLPKDGLSLPRISDLSGLEKQVSIISEDIARERGRGSASSTVANRSDILAILHRKLGLQIIADYYSQWTDCKLQGDTTALEIAKSLDSPASMMFGGAQHAAWGWDGRLLYMRARDVWHSDAVEIPNRILRQWASSYRDRGHLDLFEQAAIAALSYEQFMQLEVNREYLGLKKDTVVSNTAALKVFGLMSDKQQKEALAGGTRVDRLTPEQHKALAAVLPGSFPLPTVGPDGVLNMPVGVWTNGPPPNYRLDKPQAGETGRTPVTVSVREGTASQTKVGVKASVVGGSFESGPAGTVSNGAVITMGPGADQPGGIDYTMSVTFADSPPIEIGITIPGGEPEESSARQENK